MDIAIITGSSGLIGSEAVAFFASKFDLIIGIDNDMRSYFFGSEGSTSWNTDRLRSHYLNFTHLAADIRDYSALEEVFQKMTMQ